MQKKVNPKYFAEISLFPGVSDGADLARGSRIR